MGSQLYAELQELRRDLCVDAYDLAVSPILLILSLMALVGNSYNPFLYFQF